MLTDLKPCPFCGGTPVKKVEHLYEVWSYADRITYYCPSCGRILPTEGDRSRDGYADNSTVEERALLRWNRRTTEVPIDLPIDRSNSGGADTARDLIDFLKTRDPAEQYDTVIIQKDGRTIKESFVREDASRILELMEMTPLK